jgi:hypothetical protein
MARDTALLRQENEWAGLMDWCGVKIFAGVADGGWDGCGEGNRNRNRKNNAGILRLRLRMTTKTGDCKGNG